MRDIHGTEDQVEPDPAWEEFAVPEEPFGISQTTWKAGLILFSVFLMAATVILLMRGNTPQVIGALYAIPAILFAYFYRRRGVLIVYLLSMFFFMVVVVFRYPSADDIFAAAILGILLIAIALTVSYLTHYLLLEKRKYHAIFENTENGVILLNIADNRILEMNARFALAQGLSDNELRNRNLTDFIRNHDPLTGLVSVLDSHCSTPALELEMQREDGTGWAAVIAARKISADHAVLTFIDITERRKIDEQLRQCHADTCLYLDILTHDINNINTASLIYSRLLEAGSGESRDDILRKLIHSLEKSDEIIRNVSTLRKITDAPPLKMQFRLSDIIRREIAAFPDAGISYDGSDALVMADEMLSSVFNNLIGNSIKYGGDTPRVAIRVKSNDCEVEVSIEDNGHGIPDSLKPLVFERFQRGDMTVSGKGLGLFICKNLIERYGGRIWAEDLVPGDPAQGAILRFTLSKA
jgi:PAS domain S-box-containing protein